jgi:hypothetical protein
LELEFSATFSWLGAEHKRIVDDAVEEPVGHHRKLCFQINTAVQRQDDGALPA